MEIENQRVGAVTILKPRGALTRADADRFKTSFLEAVSLSLARVVLDASAMTFVDSKGLEVLAELSEELAHNGRSLKLCNANATLIEIFSVTDLTSLFEHYADVNSATRSFL